MEKTRVSVPSTALVPVGKGWLAKILQRHYLPARLPSPETLLPARHRATLPASHDIPLGFRIAGTGERLREEWIHYKAKHPKSLITIAAARSGKTATQLAQELGHYGGSIGGVSPSLVVNDKKGELVAICARARYALGDTVLKIDPFNLVEPSGYVIDAVWNPLQGITPASDSFDNDIFALADGLLVHQGGDPHWVDRPRQFLAPLLGNMCDDSNNEPAALPYLMTILGLPDAQLKAYMARLAEASPLPLVRHLAGPFSADTREVSSIVSSAVGQLGFLLNRNIASVLNGKSSFNWADLKRGGVSLFFCMPEAESVRYSRFSRMFWSSCINSLYRPPVHPVLAVIDEASNSLAGSTLEVFEHAFALGAGSGLRLHILFQNLPQLNSLFREQAQSILSSAGVVQLFRPNDRSTAQYLMERAGRRTLSILNEATSISVNAGENGHGSTGTSTNFSWQYYDRPLWTEQQLYEMSSSKQVLFFEGIGAPVVAFRKPYWKTAWSDRFDKNPYAPGGH